jgi:hypothetical protein
MLRWDAALNASLLDNAVNHDAHWSQDDLDAAHALREEGASIEDLASLLGRTYFAVATALREVNERKARRQGQGSTPSPRPTLHLLPIDRGVSDLSAWEAQFDDDNAPILH